MRAAGATPEEIARTVSAKRREIGIRYKDQTPPDLLQQIYDRNQARYGDPYGPTIEWFLEHDYTWEEIIESASKPGGKDLGF